MHDEDDDDDRITTVTGGNDEEYGDDEDFDYEEEETEEETEEEEEMEESMHLFEYDLPRFEMGLWNNPYVEHVKEARMHALHDYGTVKPSHSGKNKPPLSEDQSHQVVLSKIQNAIEGMWNKALQGDQSSNNLTFDLNVLKQLLSPEQLTVDSAGRRRAGASSLQQRQRETVQRMRTDRWSYDVKAMIKQHRQEE